MEKSFFLLSTIKEVKPQISLKEKVSRVNRYHSTKPPKDVLKSGNVNNMSTLVGGYWEFREQRSESPLSRLDIKTASKAQMVVDRLYKDMERRIASSPPGLCPIDMSLTFLQLCHAQSCGKCVPCRIGLGQLVTLMGEVLDGTGTTQTIETIEKTARVIIASADCAIGRDAAQLVMSGFEGFYDDYVNHVQHHRCLASLQNPVPCVSLCPAGVDVPGYVALVREGRYADAVRLIRKDNPMPTSCAYICEHPCEARCRRNMVDAPINIRGLKRYAVDHAGDVPNPPCAKDTGKRVAIIGGGPSGLSCILSAPYGA